jgi:hypothetical protein
MTMMTQRIYDVAIVGAGAELVEDYNVADVEFDSTRKLWTILPAKGGASYQTRALILADGALSRLARRLGYVSTPPEAVCSRSYIRAKSSDFVWSARLARFYRKCPVMIDASALALQRLKGPVLAQWAEIVTGACPKTDFIKPKMLLSILRDLPAALMLKQPA